MSEDEKAFKEYWDSRGWDDEGVATYSKKLYVQPAFQAGLELGRTQGTEKQEEIPLSNEEA